MVCHEVWQYNDGARTANLSGFAILCPDCNLVHHIGFANVNGLHDRAIRHMAKTNHISIDKAEMIVDNCFAEWLRRSQRFWRVEVGSDLLVEHPELGRLVQLRGRPREGGERVLRRNRGP